MHHTYTALASIDTCQHISGVLLISSVIIILGAYALRVNICLYPEDVNGLCSSITKAKVVIIDFQLQFFVAKQLVLGWLTTDWSRQLFVLTMSVWRSGLLAHLQLNTTDRVSRYVA